MNDVLFELINVEKSIIEENKEELKILKGINLKIKKGETVAIVGPSGAGKTTLLNIMGGLDRPTKGKVIFCQKELNLLSAYERANIRNRFMGFVFQSHNLLPEFSVIENVAMPAIIKGESFAEATKRALEILKIIGLKDKIYQPVSNLSGGEKQLVSIARAVVMKPMVILADEPTGNLDIKNANMISDLLIDLNKKIGTTLIIVTHNLELSLKMERRINLYGGEIKKN